MEVTNEFKLWFSRCFDNLSLIKYFDNSSLNKCFWYFQSEQMFWYFLSEQIFLIFPVWTIFLDFSCLNKFSYIFTLHKRFNICSMNFVCDISSLKMFWYFLSERMSGQFVIHTYPPQNNETIRDHWIINKYQYKLIKEYVSCILHFNILRFLDCFIYHCFINSQEILRLTEI